MELTKEYFEQYISSRMDEMNRRIDNIGNRVNEMPTKQDFLSLEKGLADLEFKVINKFEEQSVELKDYVMQAFEIQQEYMDERFKELIVAYDVRDRVTKLERSKK